MHFENRSLDACIISFEVRISKRNDNIRHPGIDIEVHTSLAAENRP